MIDDQLLSILACPEDKSPLSLADDELVGKVNEAIAAGSLVTRGGEPVEEPIEGGLVREDGAYLYVIRDDIPDLLIDDAIPLDQLS
jgi:uncharacterized protein YbaR (Trm112 family)